MFRHQASHHLYLYIAMLCWLLFSPVSHSIELIPSQAPLNLTPWAAYLEDKEGSLDFATVQTPFFASKFQTAEPKVVVVNNNNKVVVGGKSYKVTQELPTPPQPPSFYGYQAPPVPPPMS